MDNPLSLNRYTYVHNNPVNNVDPSGHWCESADGRWSHPGGCSSDNSNHSQDSEHDGDIIKENGRKVDVYAYDYSNDGVSDPLSWMDHPVVVYGSMAIGMLDGYGEIKAAYELYNTGKLVQFSNFEIKYQKHVVERLEFGSVISESEYLQKANNMFSNFTHAATRLRDKSTIFLNEATNEIMFFKDGLIQSYYKVDMSNMVKHGYKTVIDYFQAVIK